MDGCIYQTEEKRCIKFTNGKSQSWCVGKEEPCGYRKPSNADRIRSMTDEELDEWLSYICDAYYMPSNGEGWLGWRRQEAKDG